jgi:hypothetical protein
MEGVVSVMPWQCFIPQERTPIPIGWEAGQTPEPVWMQRLEEKSFAPARDRTTVIQSIVRHCTDLATPSQFNYFD